MNAGDLLIARHPTNNDTDILLVLNQESGSMVRVLRQDGTTKVFNIGTLGYCFDRTPV